MARIAGRLGQAPTGGRLRLAKPDPYDAARGIWKVTV